MLRITPVLLLPALVGLFIWQAVGLSGEAAVYPRVLLALLSITLAAFLFQEARAGRLGRGFLAEVLPQSRPGLARQAGFLATWIAYLFALPQIGFVVATWLAIVASWALVGAAGWARKVLVAAVFTLAMAVLLKTVFFVPVPQGPLDERLDEIVFSLQ